LIDTHSHIYDEAFDDDRSEVINRAKSVGVEHIILPNVDSDSLPRMLSLEAQYPDYCFAAIGLHPTSVKENYKEELSLVRSELERCKWIAVGEIGIDLYWDKTFYNEQVTAFQQQIEWALEYNLPIIIHVRDSFRETMTALAPYKNSGLRGVFHSFTGTQEDAEEILAFGGFKLGINGIVTFKNSGLNDVIRHVSLEHILLETDAPYLTPVPFRGKRNESAYIDYVCEKLAEIYGVSKVEIDKVTTKNAVELFSIII
jgi:hydrolase, TatD family